MSNPGEEASDFTWNSIYRAKVVDSLDPEKRGRVKIWCPDLMPEVDETKGIWARPANNPMGGRNSKETGRTQFFQGTCYIPVSGSWIYVFFEYGDPNEPRYLSAGDFGQSKVPIENQQGAAYDKKWMIFKSPEGRTVFISDDPHDARVEITGKKRLLSGTDPSGNAESVYETEDNQTIILLDERDGKEKILIKDHKGNFLNFNIHSGQLHANFKSDLHILSGGSIYLSAGGEINISAKTNTNIQAGEKVNIKSAKTLNLQSLEKCNILCTDMVNIQATGGSLNINISGSIAIDGATLVTQSKTAGPASPADSAKDAQPNGDRVNPSATPTGPADPPPPSPSEFILKIQGKKTSPTTTV